MMSPSQLQEGLDRLQMFAAGFRIGTMDPSREAIPLLENGNVRAWVSREILEDLPASPELEPILRRGVEMAIQEGRASGSRVVLITTTGARFDV